MREPAVVQPEELEEHMVAVQRQLESIDDEALANKVWAATAGLGPRRRALADKASAARSSVAKLHWLREEADLVAKAAAPISPCRSGCSHCCHQGVALSRREAEVIGVEIGRKVNTPAPDRVLDASKLTAAESATEQGEKFAKQRQWMVDQYEGVPCTFLKDDRCSIYKVRPTICRLHISVAPSELLCRLVIGTPISVPYVDATQEQQLYVTTMGGEGLQLADIRDWFPRSSK